MNTTDTEAVLAALNDYAGDNIFEDVIYGLDYDEAATDLVEHGDGKHVVIGGVHYTWDESRRRWNAVGRAATHQIVVDIFAQEELADGWTIPARVYPLGVDLAKVDDHDAEDAWGSKAITEDSTEWERIINGEIAENGWVRMGDTADTTIASLVTIPVRRA